MLRQHKILFILNFQEVKKRSSLWTWFKLNCQNHQLLKYLEIGLHALTYSHCTLKFQKNCLAFISKFFWEYFLMIFHFEKWQKFGVKWRKAVSIFWNFFRAMWYNMQFWRLIYIKKSGLCIFFRLGAASCKSQQEKIT